MDLSLQINKPCPENWEAMAPRAQGRFCDVCCKSVLDFTKMSEEEIVSVLKENKSVCARIPAKNSLIQPIIVRPSALFSLNTSSTNFVRILIILFFLNLTISSTNNSGDSVQKPVVVSEEDPQMIMGDMAFSPPFKTDSSAAMMEDSAYIIVETMPEFKGGSDSLRHFVQTHLQYPIGKKNAEVKIYVSFVISEKGLVTQPRIVHKSCEDSKPFEKEVLTMLKKMPRRKPGQQDGIRVPVKMILPVVFKPA